MCIDGDWICYTLDKLENTQWMRRIESACDTILHVLKFTHNQTNQNLTECLRENEKKSVFQRVMQSTTDVVIIFTNDAIYCDFAPWHTFSLINEDA